MAKNSPATVEPAPPPHPAETRPPALPSDRALTARADHITQTTAVEQARAVAEVQAAVLVAQQCPRDVDRARAEMMRACSLMALAERAFYEVRNRGSGPSVHLARELARIWGNIDYGVKELRRDDARGESEILAYAWDQQVNVRSTRGFINPHARMADGKRRPLIDLSDIYLSNQNIGARAVRECVFTVLPGWFAEEAQDLCRATLKAGGGESLDVRIAKMVERYAEIGVDVARLEGKIGHRRDRWTDVHVANMLVTYKTITRDGVPVDELVPPLPGTGRVTAEEITSRVPGDTQSNTPDNARAAGAGEPRGAQPPAPANDDEADALWRDEAKGES